MNKLSLINISIPVRFIGVYERFDKMIEKDKEFQEALQNGPSRYNHKNKMNTLRSAKIRFAIFKYLRDKEVEFLKNKERELDIKK